MNAAILVTWLGRFVLLGLLYFLLYRMYRALYETHVPAKERSGQTGRIVLESEGRSVTVWVEEPGGGARRLSTGSAAVFHDEISVGRSERNVVRVADPYVSGNHFVVTRSARGFTLTDLDTPNGTKVDGLRIDGRVTLAPGSVIEIGSVRFRFEVT